MIASIFGIILLLALVTLGAAIFRSGGDFWFCAIAGYLFTVPFALWMWHGTQEGKDAGPLSTAEWLGFFVMSVALSGFFILIDVIVVDPGFSLVFTIGVLVMAFIALPGAARAWLLEFLSTREQSSGESDA
ncbi:hypothetical protein [Polaromonas sp. LjRoot131]|uniref:hypothetical protein n=1 Tax=Polaromonas sp. LjRoot131 TaxID=3342262 RepID=UPI003ED074DA